MKAVLVTGTSIKFNIDKELIKDSTPSKAFSKSLLRQKFRIFSLGEAFNEDGKIT